jgi:hypothetical protein
MRRTNAARTELIFEELRMNDSPTRQAKHTEYALVAAIVLCVLSSIFMMNFVPDDSYISFRYAENLADGHGLRFNTNEQPVEGFSNLMWILVCALIYKAGLNLPSAMPVVGILLGLVSITLLWLLLRRRELPPLQMLFPLLILASSGPFVLYQVSGMEMPLFAALLLLMLFWLDRVFAGEKPVYYVLAALTGVLLALCRPEGVLVWPILVVFLFLSGRKTDNPQKPNATTLKNVLISLSVFVIVMVVYHAWRINYFGEWLPTPFLSKGGGGKSLLFAWVENFNYYFVKQLRYYPPVGYYFVALLVLAIAGGRSSKSASALRRTETAAIVLVVVFSLAYFNFRDWMPGMRYNAAFVGVMLLPAAHLATGLFEKTSNKRMIWMIGLTAVVLNFGVLAQLRMIADRTEKSNQLCTIPLGKWLKNVVPPGSSIAVSDVGAIPYYSELYAIDFHPESLTDLYIAKNGFSVDYIRERDPDVVIFPAQSIYVAKFYPEHFEMALDRRFDDYRLIGVSRYDWDNDRCYWVYLRGGFPKLTDAQFESFPHGVGSVMRKYR